MRFLFITPCLEPQKDGVGDYTRRLAQAVEALDASAHECRLVSWNDGWVPDVERSSTQLRLPTHCSEAEKGPILRTWLGSWQPDGVSLQWVPYGYHPRGLFYRQIKSLADAVSGWPVQLMVHETWVGAKQGSSLKARLIGGIQKRLFRRLVKRLGPVQVHTQSRAYQYLLSRAGIPNERLPLFGNIEPVEPRTCQRPSSLRCGIFGALHPEFDIEPLMEPLLTLSAELNRPLQVLHAGRMGSERARRWQHWAQRWAGRAEFIALGELGEAAVSAYLHSLDFGISTNPLTLSDKSGSIAAMMDHGLPILSTRDDVHFAGFSADLGHDGLLHRPGIEVLRQRMSSHPVGSDASSLVTVSRRFVETFLSCNS